MQAESGTRAEPSNPEPIRPTDLTDTPCPTEQRIHPVEDVVASEVAATDAREVRFRIRKRQPEAGPAFGTQGLQTLGDLRAPPVVATKPRGRAQFTPASLARARGPSARAEDTSQTTVRTPNAPLVYLRDGRLLTRSASLKYQTLGS